MAATYLTTMVVVPLGGLMTLLPAVMGACAAAVVAFVPYAVPAG
ncbi:hypothetical protein ACFYOV_08975 [Streptomyces sp. NPDC005931]